MSKFAQVPQIDRSELLTLAERAAGGECRWTTDGPLLAPSTKARSGSTGQAFHI
jgi:hypothetical protein